MALRHTIQKTQQSIAELLYKRNAELAELNRILTVLSELDAAVIGMDNDLAHVTNEIANQVLIGGDFLLSGIVLRAKSETLRGTWGQIVRRTSWDGTKHPEAIELTYGEVGDVYEHISKADFTPTDQQDDFLPYGIQLNELPLVLRTAGKRALVSTMFVLPLGRHNATSYLLYALPGEDPQPSHYQMQLLRRLQRVASTFIDSAVLSSELKSTTAKLTMSNQKLRALDEAKDEFISMASHQLRTPLTSVKGYLSMLEEGDAGKLNTTQKQFVSQAFVSSQRMVYLIADLLNVSRLKTGKFIIEASPIYLPDLIESEIAQLYETVKSRGLKMVYDKPKEFPKLNLDETKIRQVVMNFADNAIYYTPSGGEIKLSLTETAKTIEFTVTDNGIGVPKAAQHHLFTKFYRAGNARKSRPDGTGLGLFMAKKVVVAQGGAIIFKTQEGKGSTFGFTFAKDKLMIKPQDPEKVEK